MTTQGESQNMTDRTFTLSLGVGLSIILLSGCKPSLPPATPGGGFVIETLYFPQTGPLQVVGGITINASFVRDFDFTSAGDPSSFSVVTNALGLASAAGKRAPATWDFLWVSGGDPGCAYAFNNPDRLTVGLNRTET